MDNIFSDVISPILHYSMNVLQIPLPFLGGATFLTLMILVSLFYISISLFEVLFKSSERSIKR